MRRAGPQWLTVSARVWAALRANIANAIIYAAFGAAVFIASLAATFPYVATLTALLRPLSLGFSSRRPGNQSAAWRGA